MISILKSLSQDARHALTAQLSHSKELTTRLCEEIREEMYVTTLIKPRADINDGTRSSEVFGGQHQG